MHTSNVRKVSLPCFGVAFEPSGWWWWWNTGIWKQRKKQLSPQQCPGWTCWEEQNTLDPTHTGSEWNSLSAALLHILLHKAKKAGAFHTSLVLPTADECFPKASRGCAAQIHLLLDPFKKLQPPEKGAELFYKALSFICNYWGFYCTTEYNRFLNWASSIVPICLFNRAFLLLFPYWSFPFCYTQLGFTGVQLVQ